MNNNFMRPGQGNRNRNRNNRNRHRGGSGGNMGGSSSGKIFDSNGPDVKLRGTAQTIAEKYMQLGRDAQSSGDNVAAESYYQHAEHYYRIWATNQPQGASLIMSRKLGEEEFDEEAEAADDGPEDEGAETQQAEASTSESAEGAEQSAESGQHQGETQPRNYNNNRNNRFRPRWQRNRERYQPQEGNTESASQAQGEPAQVGEAAPPAIEASGQWEAPSFLQRPVPAPVPDAVPGATITGEVQAVAPQRMRTRRPREARPAPPEDTPQQVE